MRLTILGSGTGLPSPRRGSPSYLLRTAGAVAVVDTGPGSLRELARAGVGLHQVTDLLYTHAHPDHTNDLWAFLFASRNPALGTRPGPLRLHGSPGFHDFHRRVAAAFGSWVEPAGYRLEPVVHLGQRERLGDTEVSGLPVPHIASSVAWRFERQGRVLVLSGDTDYGPGIVAAARGAELLVIDCSTPDSAKLEGHATPSLCARVAAEAGVARMVLTHFYPQAEGADLCGEVRAIWPGRCELAEDFAEYELG